MQQPAASILLPAPPNINTAAPINTTRRSSATATRSIIIATFIPLQQSTTSLAGTGPAFREPVTFRNSHHAVSVDQRVPATRVFNDFPDRLHNPRPSRSTPPLSRETRKNLFHIPSHHRPAIGGPIDYPRWLTGSSALPRSRRRVSGYTHANGRLFSRLGSVFRSFWHTMTSYDRRELPLQFPPCHLPLLADTITGQIPHTTPRTEQGDTFRSASMAS